MNRLYYLAATTALNVLFLPVMQQFSFAQEKLPVAALPSESGEANKNSTLPGAATVPADTTIISKSNSADWQERLTPEFFDLIREGKITLFAKPDTHINWKNFEGAAPAQSPLPFAPEKILPYGSLEQIDQSKPDQKQRRNAILWNIASHSWSFPYTRSRLDIMNFYDGKLSRGYQGVVERVVPRGLDPQNPSAQLFREKLVLKEPAPIQGLSWLTFRFLGADEDFLFSWSPPQAKSLQLTGSNRSDLLARSLFALDDLGTWSGKVELLSGETISLQEKLLPFANVDDSSPSLVNNCIQVDRSVALNFDTRTVDGPGWIPTNVTFYPRDTIRIELLSDDPSSTVGRIILTIDAETFLPVTKSVYDRNANLTKFVFSVFDRVKLPDNKGWRYVPLASFIASRLNDDATVILHKVNVGCTQLPAEVELTQFDTKNFVGATPTPLTVE